MMHELSFEELDRVNGGDAQVTKQTITDCGKGFLVVSTTTHYTDKGNYTVTTAGWSPN